MKIIPIVLCLCLIFAVSFAAKKKEKKVEKDNWDELESILDDIDDSKKERDVSASDDKSDKKDVVKTPEENPCKDLVCGWGKECIIDKKGRPTCECTSKCPEVDDPMDKVCGSNNATFPSLCELYRQRCVCKRRGKECQNNAFAKVHLEYLGECKKLDECTDELMSQFPERMSDWLFQVMKELKKRRELRDLDWEELVSEAENDDEKKHVYPVIWKFCDLDIKPHDKSVSHHELIPITAPVIPMESCIKPFLEQCDANKDGSITIKEWGKCLGLKEGEIQERC
jgi:hypothetical protein